MNLKEENQEKTKRCKKKIMKKLKKEAKGITLIALVVTIIVLLILAAVAINLTIGNNGIFTRAQNATQKWEEASKNEQSEMDKVSNFLDEYMNGNSGGTNNPGTGEGTALGNITGNETTNTVTKDKYGNPITIPAGFKVVNPEDDVTKGIIIEDVSAPGKTADTKGSQFVWIPVGDVYTSSEHTEENKKTITLGRYDFSDDGTPSPYSGSYTEDTAENHNSSYGNIIAKDIEDFKTKATTSHGYYIGRYEAGDATATDSERTRSTSDENSIVCRTGVYPYNYVTQSQASSLARGMYTSSNFKSDLINSYAWDTAIVFIQTFSGDENYSRQVGKNTTSSLKKCGESILNSSYVDDGDEEKDVRCNIYDMAGNTYEWTTETYSDTSYPCVNRGGNYRYTYYYTSSRPYNNTTSSHGDYCFRPTLYL